MVDANDVFGDLDPTAIREENLDNTIVKLVCQAAKCPQLYQQLRAKIWQERGADAQSVKIPFDSFMDEYPQFPLRLEGHLVKHDWALGLFDALRKGGFGRTQCYKKYRERADELEIDLQEIYFGVVFAIHGKSKFVLHNWPRDEETHDRTITYPRLVIPMAGTSPPMIYSLESFESLLAAIGDEWVPHARIDNT